MHWGPCPPVVGQHRAEHWKGVLFPVSVKKSFPNTDELNGHVTTEGPQLWRWSTHMCGVKQPWRSLEAENIAACTQPLFTSYPTLLRRMKISFLCHLNLHQHSEAALTSALTRVTWQPTGWDRQKQDVKVACSGTLLKIWGAPSAGLFGKANQLPPYKCSGVTLEVTEKRGRLYKS